MLRCSKIAFSGNSKTSNSVTMHIKNAIHYTDMQHGSDYLNKGPSSFFGFKVGNEHINEWKIVIYSVNNDKYVQNRGSYHKLTVRAYIVK